ncbi:MAG: hypothetical protein FJ224_09905 [Lentisphaerae bacterium]|nr:hypothetical protein [Lentisphaerota bacterium]
MSIFEILMLVCFGVSWPVSIAKTLRTRVVAGKSPVFLAIVCAGYAFGLAHKLLNDRDWVTALYAVNMAMVAADLALYMRYRPQPGR